MRYDALHLRVEEPVRFLPWLDVTVVPGRQCAAQMSPSGGRAHGGGIGWTDTHPAIAHRHSKPSVALDIPFPAAGYRNVDSGQCPVSLASTTQNEQCIPNSPSDGGGDDSDLAA